MTSIPNVNIVLCDGEDCGNTHVKLAQDGRITRISLKRIGWKTNSKFLNFCPECKRAGR